MVNMQTAVTMDLTVEHDSSSEEITTPERSESPVRKKGKYDQTFKQNYTERWSFINPFGAIGDCSRPPGRPLLSTLVDITSCNDVIKTAALRCKYKLIQRKQYIYVIHRNT